MGNPGDTEQWAEKVIVSNRHAANHPASDYIRHVRALGEVRGPDAALAMLVRYEKEVPGVRQAVGTHAIRTTLLVRQLAQEITRLQHLATSVRERREMMLGDMRNRIAGLLQMVEKAEVPVGENIYVSEALLEADRVDGSVERAVDGLLQGEFLPANMGSPAWRNDVEAALLMRTENAIRAGLQLMRTGQTEEAVSMLEGLMAYAHEQLRPQLYANLAMACLHAGKKAPGHPLRWVGVEALTRLGFAASDSERLPRLREQYEDWPLTSSPPEAASPQRGVASFDTAGEQAVTQVNP